jgi:hypothetical protein
MQFTKEEVIKIEMLRKRGMTWSQIHQNFGAPKSLTTFKRAALGALRGDTAFLLLEIEGVRKELPVGQLCQGGWVEALKGPVLIRVGKMPLGVLIPLSQYEKLIGA